MFLYDWVFALSKEYALLHYYIMLQDILHSAALYADEADMVIMEGGMPGKRHKDTDRFLPIMNFTFKIQHFVGDEQMGNFFI